MTLLNFFYKYRINVSFLVLTICLVRFLPDLSFQTIMVSLCFTSLWTFIYLYNKVTDTAEDAINVAGFPVLEKDQKITLVVSFLCLLLPVFYLFQWPSLLGLYCFLGLIPGYGYSKKIKIFNKSFRFKDIIFVKNATSAASWGAFATFVPVFYYNAPLSLSLFFIWLNFFIIVLAVEIVWDIRDIKGDLKAGVRTLPNTLGVFYSKTICAVSIIGFLFWRLSVGEVHPIFLLAYALTLVSILTIKETSHPYAFQNLILIWIVANSLFLTIHYI